MVLAIGGALYGIALIFNNLDKYGHVTHWGAFVGGWLLIANAVVLGFGND